MRHSWTIVFIAVCLLASGPVPASDDVVGGDIAKDIRGIRNTLESIAATQQKQFRTNLILKRIELHERRLEPLAQRLDDAESEHRNAVDNLDGLTSMKDQIEARLQEEIQEGVDRSRSETRMRLDDIRRSIESTTDHERDALLRVREAEDRMIGLQRKIEILDDMLEQVLEELGR